MWASTPNQALVHQPAVPCSSGPFTPKANRLLVPMMPLVSCHCPSGEPRLAPFPYLSTHHFSLQAGWVTLGKAFNLLGAPLLSMGNQSCGFNHFGHQVAPRSSKRALVLGFLGPCVSSSSLLTPTLYSRSAHPAPCSASRGGSPYSTVGLAIPCTHPLTTLPSQYSSESPRGPSPTFLSALRLLLLKRCAPIFVLHSSPMILCRFSPERLSCIQLSLCQPDSAHSGILEGCSVN